MSPPPARTSATLPYKNTPTPSPASSSASSSLNISLSSSHLAGTVTPPVAYQPLSPPPSTLVNPKDLPSPDTLFRTILHDLPQCRGDSAMRPIHIDLVSPAVFEQFLNDHGDAIRQQHLKLEYVASSCRIIVYGPPTPYHDCTPFFLQKVLFGLQGTAFDTPARQDTLAVREISFRSRDGSFLVPDAAVVVIDDEAPPRLWPTIVVEVANTQSYDDALAKINRWFVKSRNTVEVALLLKFVAKDPLVDPSCFLESYRGRVVDADAVGEGIMDIDSESESGGDDEPGAEGSLSGDDDDTDHLRDDENDRSASPDDQPTVETTSPPSPADEPNEPLETHVDSDSSLSSLDDEDLDLDLGLDDPPVPAKPRLQVYIADTRKTVLPVSDPPEPEMRFLSLRYSDFFGSENVPDGKDPAEEVRLDLDILRREVRNLVRLTVRQVGSLKRRAGGGQGAAGKREKR